MPFQFVSRYQKAIEIYEAVARQSINNNLLKYGVRGHLLNAGICQLCKGDVVAITNALERYQVKYRLLLASLNFLHIKLHIQIKMSFAFAGTGSDIFRNT